MFNLQNPLTSRQRTAMAAGLAAAGIVLTVPVHAEEGPYVGLAGGWNAARDLKLRAAGGTSKIEFDNGWGGLGTVGYALGTGLRVEAEFGYRRNKLDKVDRASAGGKATAMSVMGNVLYDIDLGVAVKPYLGIGLGAAQVRLNPGSLGSAKDRGFAYQGIVGAGFGVTDQLNLTLDYRYFAVSDLELRRNNQEADADYAAHGVMLGLRYNFGAPARPAPEPVQATEMKKPEAAPKPAPAQAKPKPEPAPVPEVRNFVVFFDFDQADLTAEARDILREAADSAKANAPVRIEVSGHADRAGSRDYNRRLSLQRAEAVADALVQLGVGRDAINVAARGEDEPLVSTDDNVREPQNRRVEIVVRQTGTGS